MSHVVTISTPGGPSFTTSTEAIKMAADHMSGHRRKGKDIDDPDDDPAGVPGFAAKQLLSIVERIERLEEEKKCIADDIKDVYGEAKANGYDTKALRQCVRLRKMDANEREEEEAILELYKNALGMV